MLEHIAAVVPAYNAERHIDGVIRGLLRHLPARNVIVVDDGSTDGTAGAAARGGAVVLRHSENRGKGAALRTGFAAALALPAIWAVVMLDADGQHDPGEVPRFAEAFAGGAAELVVGNRMGVTGAMPPIRVLTNRFTSAVVSLIAGQRVPDTQNGYRLAACGLLRRVELVTDRYEIESELVIKASRAGARIASIPVSTIYGSERSAIHPLRDTLRFFSLVFRSFFW
jgi:glycosyltransferase involved in cell wall biosynthesis